MKDKRMCVLCGILILLQAVIISTKQVIFTMATRNEFANGIATIISLIIYCLTPSNSLGGIKPIIILFYGSVVTPVFEEILL